MIHDVRPFAEPPGSVWLTVVLSILVHASLSRRPHFPALSSPRPLSAFVYSVWADPGETLHTVITEENCTAVVS